MIQDMNSATTGRAITCASSLFAAILSLDVVRPNEVEHSHVFDLFNGIRNCHHQHCSEVENDNQYEYH
jgi:hypothetical protein